MIKIGIEINGIVRDLNSQILKYYTKDIDKSFDDKSVDKNVITVIDKLEFGSKQAKKEFMYIDYPYELFGCAKPMHRNLSVMLNNWIKELENIETNEYNLCLFSLFEEGLTIQSTYFFLSKIGSRIREMFFPKDGSKMWDICDIIITTNANIVNNKPDNKKVVLIRKNDNTELEKNSDLVYDSLMDIITDVEFVNKISITDIKKENKFKKILKKIFLVNE